MISDDDETEISKSLIKTEINIKTQNNLKWEKIKTENQTKN